MTDERNYIAINSSMWGLLRLAPITNLVRIKTPIGKQKEMLFATLSPIPFIIVRAAHNLVPSPC